MGLQERAWERRRTVLEAVLASPQLTEAPSLRKLLEYLAERALDGTAADLKEYTIGVELFGRPATYTPQSDPSVRVQASRLRIKLDEYFRGAGAGSDVVIRLPKGSFALAFEDRVSGEPPRQPRRLRTAWLIGGAFLCLVFVCVYQAVRLRTLSEEARRRMPAPEVIRLWQPLLASRRPLLLVLGTPVFVDLGNAFYRSPMVNSPEDFKNSAEVQALFRRIGIEPKGFSSPYTGVGESIAMFLLGQMFFGAGKQVNVSRSSTLAWDEFGTHDLVILGSTKSNPQMRDLAANTNYRLVPGGIQVARPDPGEPSMYTSTRSANSEVVADYVVVSRRPGIGEAGYIVMIGSESTPGNWAGAQYLTTANYARQLASKLADARGRIPDYFEVLLRADFKSGRPIRIEYVKHQLLNSAR
jgi:hypothetical protein